MMRQWDSRLKFTKIDYARLMQGNYGISEYISKYVKRINPFYFRRCRSQKESSARKTDKDGNGFIGLKSKYGTVVGWRIEMKDDFVQNLVRLNSPITYTSFKDPERPLR